MFINDKNANRGSHIISKGGSALFTPLAINNPYHFIKYIICGECFSQFSCIYPFKNLLCPLMMHVFLIFKGDKYISIKKDHFYPYKISSIRSLTCSLPGPQELGCQEVSLGLFLERSALNFSMAKLRAPPKVI